MTHGVEQDLYSYFTSDKHIGRGGDGGLDMEDCEKISAILAKHRLDECLTIDLARRSDSHEAWIYVYLKTQAGQYGPPVEGFGELPLHAILTWGNSD